ncbi:hypothetical protein VPH35_137527 [Triticum aestivum]
MYIVGIFVTNLAIEVSVKALFCLLNCLFFRLCLRLDDDVWEVQVHFHNRDNLERTMCISDITNHNLIELIETEGYGSRDYMCFVRNVGVGITGLEETSDDDKVDEMLNHIANEDKKIVNLTVTRDTGPRPVDLNKCHVCEQQLPFSDFGEPTMYEINNDGVLFISPSKNLEGAAQVQHANAL